MDLGGTYVGYLFLIATKPLNWLDGCIVRKHRMELGGLISFDSKCNKISLVVNFAFV